MKIYFSIGAMFVSPHSILRKLAAICMCAVAIACAQSASAQSLGEWQEPPGGNDWPLIARHALLMPNKQILTWEGAGASARLWDLTTGDFTCWDRRIQ